MTEKLNLSKYGFREGFSFDNRFDIKTPVEYRVLNNMLSFVISTVDLGLDHNFSNDGPPIYYETMIFLADSSGKIVDGRDYYCMRYSTEEEALIGHNMLVEAFKYNNNRIPRLENGSLIF